MSAAPSPPPGRAGGGDTAAQRQTSLVDLLDRLLSSGVVITGDITIAVADVELVRVSLRALVSSINDDVPSPWGPEGPLPGPQATRRPEPVDGAPLNATPPAREPRRGRAGPSR